MNHTVRYCLRKYLGVFLAMILFSLTASGQYFGRNKPDYKNFRFRVYRTPHFEFYHYMKNDSLVKQVGALAEDWYNHHLTLFKDTFTTRNPIILYSNQADFQQTTAISGEIGMGTGGVTEGLKNRIVMPFNESMGQTSHIIGHEMVHAFQYNLLLHSEDSRMRNLRNIPLWLIEGMAEYFSIGSEDPNTAMWMRDAVQQNDFPSLDDLTRSNKYFPYRYGQAFLAFVGKVWGDSVIVPLLDYTSKFGLEIACDSILKQKAVTVGNMWKSATYVHYKRFLTDSIEPPVGTKLLSEVNAGRNNLAPMLSPDGKYVAFVSEKDVFTYDLYLADAATGTSVRKLFSTVNSGNIDQIHFIESSGTWSPDSRQFAFVIFKEGYNRLLILDVPSGKKRGELIIPGLESFSNPAWSPNGEEIVVTGLKEGKSDLWVYNLRHKRAEQITNDAWANMQPAWSPDGRKIAFTTDMPGEGQPQYHFRSVYNIAFYDRETREITTLNIFPGANNMNPVFSADGKSLYFLSDRDGMRNLYRYDFETAKVFRLTNFYTGISGITMFSPALSVSPATGVVAYTYYQKGDYTVFSARPEQFRAVEMQPDQVDKTAGTLPPAQRFGVNIVDRDLSREKFVSEIPADKFKYVPFRRKFKLDYIGNSGGVGVATSRYGTGVAGSVETLFSDITGENQMYAALGLNGEIYDFGGQFAYINQERRINWGGSVSHIPYRFGSMGAAFDTARFVQQEDTVLFPLIKYSLYYYRLFEDKISLFGYYPFSQTRRIEAGASVAWYYYRLDIYNTYYTEYMGYPMQYFGESVQRNQPVPKGFNIQEVDLAYVGDNSYFGMTSPLRGYRMRVGGEKYFGSYNFYTGLFDFRKYFFIKPVNFSFRLYHYGRYGKDAENMLYSSLYIGYPWYIRGYDNAVFTNYVPGTNSMGIENLLGSRMALFNFEFRVPTTGIEQLALIKSKFLYTEAALFFDAGVAWNSGARLRFSDGPVLEDTRVDYFTGIAEPFTRKLVTSAGISLRINLFGYLVLEPYYAIPFQRNDLKFGTFGLNFLPGW